MKFLLDKNLLDQKIFEPQVEKCDLKKILIDVVHIVQVQSRIKNIDIKLKFAQKETKFMLD